MIIASDKKENGRILLGEHEAQRNRSLQSVKVETWVPLCCWCMATTTLLNTEWFNMLDFDVRPTTKNFLLIHIIN